MLINELNNCIVHYAKRDKTKRSILLKAPWGQGKTYYVKNELINQLSKEGIDFVYISLYGIENIKELNKHIYLEIRGKKILKKSELRSAGILVGKTIANGVASFFGVNLNISNRDLNRLYKSIKLNNYLLIFDDLERSSINKIEILGYINNLVEHDGAHALFVANEDEILSSSIKDKYIAVKEKTISETLFFDCNFKDAISNITKEFSDNPIFKKVLETKDEYDVLNTNEKILNVMRVMNVYNLRSVISACQKTSDIFSMIKDEYSYYFLQSMLLGNISYYLKNNQNNDSDWGNNPSLTSSELGCLVYPMFYPSFLYIKTHNFYKKIFDVMNETFVIARNQEIANEDLKIIYDWFNKKETDVRNALISIKKNLVDVKVIPVTEYLRLFNYLISLEKVLTNDFSSKEYEDIMIANIEKEIKSGKKCDIYLYSGIKLEDENQISKFNEFKTKLSILIKEYDVNKLNNEILNFNSFVEHVKKNKDYYVTNGGFACKLDVPSLISLIKTSSSYEIAEINHSFMDVYSFSNLVDYFTNDVDNLILLKNELIKLENYEKFDAIQKQQVKWFSDYLQNVIEKIKN